MLFLAEKIGDKSIYCVGATFFLSIVREVLTPHNDTLRRRREKYKPI